MPERPKDAWKDVEDRFSELGRIVAERYRTAAEERGDAGGSEEAQRKVEEAFSTVTRQLDLAFTSVGDTFRDPQARETLKQAGKAMVSAMSSTVSEVGEQLKKRRWR